MNRLLCLSLVCLPLFAAAQSGPAHIDGCGKSMLAKRLSNLGYDWKHRDGNPFNPSLRSSQDSDVLKNNLTIEVNPNTGSTISGTNVMTIKNLLPGATSFRFQLDNNFTISQVLLNGSPITITREDTHNVLANFGRTMAMNEQYDLSITYSGTAVTNGFGSIEFGTRSSGAKYCFTLSEPYFSSTWWPTKDDNTDKATLQIGIICPNTMSAVSNGNPVGTETLTGSRTKYKFQTNYQIAPYLVCMGVTNFNTFTSTWTGVSPAMPLTFYIWPENDTTTNRNAWLNVTNMLTTLSGRYGTYPFANERYGIYEFTFSGGMEHQTITGEGTFSEYVTAHELGHQWWGDMVTCATWSDIWLNEGFASYTEALWAEWKTGTSSLTSLKSYMSSLRPSSVNGTVYCSVTTDVNRIFSTSFSYRKPAWVLHMLRHILGDTKFFQLLAQYRSQYQYSSATTEDFIAVAEQVYGGSLRWFFDPWIYQVGAPAYTWGSSTTTINGQTYLLVSITQSQSTSYPLFTMPVDIGWKVGATTFRQPVWSSAQKQYAVIPVSGTPSSITFDTDTWILDTAVTAGTYQAGPPVVVATTPAIGGMLPHANRTATVTFHTPINFSASAVMLQDRMTGAILTPGAISYDATQRKLSVTIPPKTATTKFLLTVNDSITATNSGLKLDGEVSIPASMPSGDGIPGGSFVFSFDYSDQRKP